MPARFHEQDVTAGLKRRRALSAFLDALVRQHRPEVRKVQLTFIFCNDTYLHGINVQFLAHDTLTDIITFDLSERQEELTGEIYISTERVAENAATYGSGYERELHRVIFHGALHLCGFRDKKKSEQQQMRAQEQQCLDAYFKDEA